VKKSNTYEIVTHQIVELLEKNENPWTKPWVTRSIGGQKNLVSQRPYKGLNALILSLQNRSTDYWLTFKQADELGFKIAKGSKSTPIIGWFRSSFEKEVETENGETENGETEIELKSSGLRARVFRVFNLDQCENVPESLLQKTKRPQVQTFEDTRRPEIDAIIGQTKAKILFGFEQAAYYPALDVIKMPDRNRFPAESEFYSTVFHELGHWTGHKSRLNRSGIEKVARFASETYSQEEMVAEMCSVYVCSSLGVSNDSTTRNSVAYLQGFLKLLKNDPKAFVIACQQGQKAADLILKEGEK